MPLQADQLLHTPKNVTDNEISFGSGGGGGGGGYPYAAVLQEMGPPVWVTVRNVATTTTPC